jgi:hypothetical protein
MVPVRSSHTRVQASDRTGLQSRVPINQACHSPFEASAQTDQPFRLSSAEPLESRASATVHQPAQTPEQWRQPVRAPLRVLTIETCRRLSHCRQHGHLQPGERRAASAGSPLAAYGYSVPRASEHWKVVTTLAPQRRGITSKTATAQFALATAQFLLSLDEKAPWVLE